MPESSRKAAPRVEIEWLDSGVMLGNDQWTPTGTIMNRAFTGTAVTVGHLLQLNEEVAIVGLSYDADYDNWFGVQVIERSSIRKITVLRARREYLPDMFDTLPSGMV